MVSDMHAEYVSHLRHRRDCRFVQQNWNVTVHMSQHDLRAHMYTQFSGWLAHWWFPVGDAYDSVVLSSACAPSP
eukprot:5544129-Pyramimonas_sp.AAC.1